ncbi:WSC domain-containing protein [Lactarius quietus]|nr:WSC domain-containing protein [Lactarius quietus]
MHSIYTLLAGFQLAVTGLLAIVPSISATSSQNVVQRDKPMLPQGWPSLGCFTDDPSHRTLTSKDITDASNLTVECCVNSCKSQNYIYAGVENGNECYCGNKVAFVAEGIPQSQCSSKCVGNYSESCGGSESLELYWSGAIPSPKPIFIPSVDNWYFYGCFNDSDDRTLNLQGFIPDNLNHSNSVRDCVLGCELLGFFFAGVEHPHGHPDKCWCGNSINNPSDQIDLKYCISGCSWNGSEACDGAESLIVYNNLVLEPNGS